ncbi:O-antigen ligase family protein [Micromonospora auratinigra]|uniref:O-antigen ligase n=1 Tax=Micromonospora auratinigra TaxID=261654 RepID=A0A1A8Z1H8_9ACTN|nr:O-antigen ligase family protein [Micromonospora auratinigra]SBT37745.1 O-antigen ligase [Micromonospora auratinigra]
MRSRRGTALWALLSVAAVLAVPAAVVLVPGIPVVRLLVEIVLAVGALCLVVARPSAALAIGVAAPVLQTAVPSTLLTLGALALLFVVIGVRWRGATATARRRASFLLATGVVTVLLGLLVTGPADDVVGTDPSLGLGVGGIPLAIIYATVLGAAATIVGPNGRTVACWLAVLGVVAAIAALETPALGTDRNTVVLGENANGIGMFTAVGLIAGLVTARRARAVVRVAGWAAAVVCALGVIASGSRGALLAVVAGGAALIFHRAIVARPAKAVPAMLVVLTLLAVTAGPLADRFLGFVGREQTGAQLNVVGREDAARYAIEQGLAHPLTGVGLGRLAQVSAVDPAAAYALRAHNVFAGAFAESGLLVVLALLGICVLALLAARRFAPATMLPLVTAVVISSVSVEWWGFGRTGPCALLVLGAALGLRMREPDGVRAAAAAGRSIPPQQVPGRGDAPASRVPLPHGVDVPHPSRPPADPGGPLPPRSRSSTSAPEGFPW